MTIDREHMEQIAPYIIPAICISIGVILLCAGGRLLKSAVGLSFGLMGAGTGLLLAPSLSLGISPLITALIFGIITAIIAVYLAKLAILLALGISFAIVTPIITWHVADLGPSEQMVEDVIEAATAPDNQFEAPSAQPQTNFTSTEAALISTVKMVSHDAIGSVRSGMRRANAAWDAIPTGPRLILVGSALAGLLLGLLVATFMSYFASALVTSVGGSFLLIEGIRTVASTIWSQHELSAVTPAVLVGATIAIALAGLGLQLTFTRQKKIVKQAAK